MIMGCTGNYWTARGKLGSQLCSPMDATCIAQGSSAISQFNGAWSQCAAPSKYMTLVQNSQDPNQSPVDQQYSAVPTAAPSRPLHPHPPMLTTGNLFWMIGQQFPFQPKVVNPSPGSQNTSDGTSRTTPGSAVSQANGGNYITGGYASSQSTGLDASSLALLVGAGLLLGFL